MSNLPNQKLYKDLKPFDLVLIQKFPFIEEDFDAINIYGIISKIKDCLNTTIANQQIVQENQTDLYDYVNTYFTNLDVQVEINNKLDDMTESGQLAEIIESYINLNSLIIFNNVQTMKNAQNLKDGSNCKTLGFYSVNDGGSCEYLIKEITNNDIIDNITIIPLQNNLVAHLILKDEMSPEQFGAYGDGIHNDTLSLQKACDSEKIVKCNNKTYLVNEEIKIKTTFIMDNFSKIKADNNFLDNIVVSITKDRQRRNMEYYINVDSNAIAEYGICVGKPRFCKLFLNVTNAGQNGIDCDYYEGNGNGGNTFNCTVVGNTQGTTEKGIIVDCWDSIFNLIVTQDCKIGVYLDKGELIAENVHCWLSDTGASNFWDESYCIYDVSFYRMIINWLYQDSVKYGIGGKGAHGLIRYFEYTKNLSDENLYNDEINLTCNEGSVRLTIDKFMNSKNERKLLKYSLNQSNSHEFGVTQKNGTISSKNILQNETPFTDMNDMPQWGTFYVKYDTLNLPINQGGVVKSEIIGNCVIQTYYSANTFVNYGRYYKRVREIESDTWSNWFEYKSTTELQ